MGASPESVTTEIPAAPPAPDPAAVSAPLRARRRFLLGVVTGAVVMALAGLGAATFVKSPQQAAAEAEPPPASVITAPVELRVLKQTVVLRGTVEPERALEVKPVPGGGRSVISRRTVGTGDFVEAGTVLAEISGRPVVALPGRVPPYRDIRPGMRGSDVEQVQSALRAIGYRITDDDGVFGASTRRAVGKMYQARDYDPPLIPVAEPSPDEASDPKKPVPKSEVYLPMSEVYFVRSLPARVTAIRHGLGTEVTGPILTLSVGGLVVRGTLAPADRELVDTGMAVEIRDESTDRVTAGTVASIGDLRRGAEAEQDPQAAGHPVTVRGTKALPAALAGEEVRLTVTAATTGEPVLVVPVSAIFSAADGSSQVLRALAGGRRQPVTVRTGSSSGGFVEVTATGLAEGDPVVVGERLEPRGADGSGG